MRPKTLSILTLLLFFAFSSAGAVVRFINYDMPHPEQTNRVVDLIVTFGNSKLAAVRSAAEEEKIGGVAGIHMGVWNYIPEDGPTSFAPLAVDLRIVDKSTEVWAAGDNEMRKIWTADTTYTTADGRITKDIVLKWEAYDAAYFGFTGEVTFNDIEVDPDDGSIWVSSTGGILRLSEGEWNILDGPATCIAIDGQGIKYFGTESSGVIKCEGLTCTNLIPAEELVGGVTAITIDRRDRLWFATFRPGQISGTWGTSQIILFEDGNLTRKILPDPWGSALKVADMAADRQGNILFATLGGGVKKFDGTTWTSYTTEDLLADNTVNTVAVESHDKIWFGTDNGISLMIIDEEFDLMALEDKEILSSSPLIDSTGHVFFGKSDGIFYAYSVTPVHYALKEKWTFETGAEILSSPSVDRESIFYFGSSDHSIYALYPDGTLKWSYETGDGVISSPAVGDDGTIYAGSKDGYLYALNHDGTLKWRFETGGPVWSSPGLGTDGTVYFGSHDKNFYALTPGGELKWTYPTGGEIFSSPAVGYQGAVYFGSNDYFIYALNPDGSLEWSYETGGEVISSPTVDFDETVYVGSTDYFLYAINPQGTLAWRCKINAPIWSSPVINTAGQIVCGSSNIARLDTDLEPVTDFEDLDPPIEKFTVDRDGNIKHRNGSSNGNSSTPAVWVKGPIRQVGDYSNSMTAGSELVAGYDGKTNWPKFRHDYRNTGNVAASLEITVKGTTELPADIFCDINGDGYLNISDAIMLMIKGRDNPDDPSLDFDGDGSYTVVDVVELLFAMQLGTCRPPGAALASGALVSPVEKIQGLSPEDIDYIENMMPELTLTAGQEAEFRLALYGEAGKPGLPQEFSLAQNSPNPFNPSTTISYTVPEGSNERVYLNVYNIRGALVRTLVDRVVTPGSYQVFWDGTDNSGRQVGSGPYFYRLEAGDFVRIRKMVLLK